MLAKQKRTLNNEGFTIIEVMIVLAIAGLILLIVLLAVPALQRNARNTTIKNDASSLAGSISTFESDNNGSTPTGAAGTGTVVVSGGAGTVSEKATLNNSTIVSATSPAGGDIVGSVVTDVPTSNVYAVFGKSCAAAAAAVSTGATSSRSVALYYVTETTSGNSLQCVSS
jgi:prepilin-type N-terminal cleavage/methylation domain-containing protein